MFSDFMQFIRDSKVFYSMNLVAIAGFTINTLIKLKSCFILSLDFAYSGLIRVELTPFITFPSTNS